MRQDIVDYLRKEMIGPDPKIPFIQQNQEEILTGPPTERYSMGILFPQEYTLEDSQNNDEVKTDDQTHEKDSDINMDEEKSSTADYLDEEAEENNIINLTNKYLPSAIGFSCLLDIPIDGLRIKIKAARYIKNKFKLKEGDKEIEYKDAYFRESLDSILTMQNSELKKNHVTINKILTHDNEDTGLELVVINRAYKRANVPLKTYTFSIVNRLYRKNGRTDSENCFFQIGFSVESIDASKCFLPYEHDNAAADEEEESNELLYDEKKTFAVGHGCSPTWDLDEIHAVPKISAEIMPSCELQPIIPRTDIDLPMFKMSTESDNNFMPILENLCNAYEKWIGTQAEKINSLKEKHRKTAQRHLTNCRVCLLRMREGLTLIDEHALIKKAFRFMNTAMLLQQLRFRLKIRNWEYENDDWKLENNSLEIPKDLEQWSNNEKVGRWYPFQLAFILLNIAGMTNKNPSDRDIVDLIWFPTGGGKTEAYLGLSAFTIFYRRLVNPEDDGTTILMRYTLRLLTNQQFQRASSLICACDYLRSLNVREFGERRITIGLWVGKDLSPNNRQDAKKQLKILTRQPSGETPANPFLLYKCPWCGAQIGPVKSGLNYRVFGYSDSVKPGTVVFKCQNNKCEFSTNNNYLPLLIIDEDIYDNPPTLLLGTVDKFAVLVWKPENARRLFGYREKKSVSPPDLIIQDELHLISGPLGSLAGLYEILINELTSTHQDGNTLKRSKIIASTATLSRAKEQINGLYARDVFQFPPQALKTGESFFAVEDKKSNGRMYVGINAPALSHPMAHVRTTATLLQSVHESSAAPETKNYYWTILDYFNSLRELGYAVTRVQADVREHLNIMWNRKDISAKKNPELRRFPRSHIELTSRIESDKVAQSLKILEIDYSGKEIPIPVDICLATNMISVGVDVARLGLMTMTGQPKSTSEYIQCTSRVGRSPKGPGLVVVIYNPTKARDRSHYERFVSYHSKIYSFVEPTSVTPFALPALERALHAILIGMVRYFGNEENMKKPQTIPDSDLLDWIKKVLIERVKISDPEEKTTLEEVLNKRISEWKKFKPPLYGSMYPKWSVNVLMYPWDANPPPDIKKSAWPTPTSMRNVDPSCEASIIENYGIGNDGVL